MGQQAFFAQIGEAPAGEFGMTHFGRDAGAEVLGQGQTGRDLRYCPEKKAKPDRWQALPSCTPQPWAVPEKDTAAVVARADFEFSTRVFAVAFNGLFRREMQKCGKTREVGGADHNAAAAFTAVAAHAALKHSFRALGSHEQPTLCLLFRRAAKQAGVFHHQAGVFHHGHARRLKQFPRFGRDNA